MRLAGLATFAVFVAGSATAQSAERFKLSCSGTNTFASRERDGSMTAKPSPLSLEINVDLTNKKVCFGRCEAMRDIHQADPQRIVFTYDVTDPKIRTVEQYTYADMTYRSQTTFAESQTAIAFQGRCTMSEYGGL